MEVEIVVPNELHTPDETIGLCDGCYGCYLRSCNIAAEVTGVSLANAMMDGRSHFGPIVIEDQEIIVISDDEEEEEDELEEEEEDDRQRSRRVAFYQCIEINKALFETLDFYGEEF